MIIVSSYRMYRIVSYERALSANRTPDWSTAWLEHRNLTTKKTKCEHQEIQGRRKRLEYSLTGTKQPWQDDSANEGL